MGSEASCSVNVDFFDLSNNIIVKHSYVLLNKLGEESLSAKRRAIGMEFSKIKKNDGCYLHVYDKKFRYNYIMKNLAAHGGGLEPNLVVLHVSFLLVLATVLLYSNYVHISIKIVLTYLGWYNQ